MSYPRGLDEYSDDELRSELDRRDRARRAGRCDYCGGWLGQPTASGHESCRFPTSHFWQPTPQK